MPQALRRFWKPECISALTLRARARAFASCGHKWQAGNFSARYSAIASVSQIAKSSSTSTGTLPEGLIGPSRCLNRESAENESKRTITSSNEMPACLSSTQGRMDQEE